MRNLVSLTIALLVACYACDLTPRTAATMPDAGGPPLRLQTPDPSYRIPEAERAMLREGIDPEALQRFLGMVHPSYRSRILATFIARRPGEAIPLFDRVPDPLLQRSLDEVWAPRRRLLTPEVESRAERNLSIRSEPFDVLLVAELPAGARGAALVVHAGPGLDQVILLEREATPSLLLAASERLMESRMRHGLAPTAETRLELSSEDDHNRDLPGKYLPRQQELLDRLRAEPARPYPELGLVRRARFQALRGASDLR